MELRDGETCHCILSFQANCIVFVQSLRAKDHKRLFPELALRRDGYQLTASKWFRRYRVWCGHIPCPELSRDDLDLAAARELFKGRRTLDGQALLTLKLLRREQGKEVPTRGAMLLFGKERN